MIMQKRTLTENGYKPPVQRCGNCKNQRLNGNAITCLIAVSDVPKARGNAYVNEYGVCDKYVNEYKQLKKGVRYGKRK